MRFAGQVALVTGGSRGIGRATALDLGAEGAQVWIGYKQNEGAAHEVAELVTASGGRGVPVPIDMESPSSITAAFARIRSEAGALDLLVANAAATAFKPLMESRAHNLDRTFQITVNGFLQLCQEGAPLMAGRHGKIVAVSGYDSIRYIPGHGTLGAAKAAMESMVRYLAVELAPEGINVNGVCPGPVATDSAILYAGPLWAEIERRVSAATPRKRIGTPEDVAKIIAFLCSAEADWLCGQTLICDGGLTLDGGAALFGIE